MRRFLTLLLTVCSGLAVRAHAQAADPLQPILTFARAQPGDIAISVVSLEPGGAVTPALRWNDTQLMPLASAMKIVVLAAYARAVEAGTLKPEQPVKLADWEAFYLPGTDGGAHADSLKALDITADEWGRATTPEKTVSLDTLARFMLETSDNAATDFILNKLGKDAVPATIRALGLRQHEDIGPVSGMFHNWDRAGATYLKATPAQRRALDWQQAERVRLDAQLRQPSAAGRQYSEAEMTLAVKLHNATPPRGTTAEYAALLGRVLSAQGFSATEVGLLHRHLSWPMRVNPDNARFFKAFYAKGGSLGGGVLTNNFAMDWKSGNKVVYSIFLRNIPENQYAAIQASLHDFMLLTLAQPDAQQRLLAALGLKR